MSPRGIAERLVAAGLPERERAAKAELFERAFHLLGGDAGAAWWVPGRLEVFGKHTDYAGGRSLVCAVPRGTAVAARVSSRCGVHVTAEDGTTVSFDSRSEPPTRGWAHYADVVVRRLERNFPGSDAGVEIAFAGDLPRASGLSSSSVLVVALAEAIVRLRGIDRAGGWLANVPDRLAASAYYACIENGAACGTLAGDAGVGTHGGSEDHAAIMTAVSRQLSAFAFVPPRLLERVPVPADWAFVIAPSGARAEKTGAARDPYNQLSDAARSLVALWNAHRAPASSLAAALRDGGADAVRDLHELIDADAARAPGAKDMHDRLEHFVREDARIPLAVAAFAAADTDALEALSAVSQADADALLRNQVDATRSLASSARVHGAFASCSFGAGFGGSVWALVRSDDAIRFAREWHPGAFVAEPGPPVTEIQLGGAEAPPYVRNVRRG